MADDGDNSAEESQKGGGGKKIILLAIMALVLIGASVGGTVAVLSMTKEEPPPMEETDMEDEGEEQLPDSPAIYYPLKPEYIVNIDARGRRRYLRLDITVLTREDDVIPELETHRAAIDNAINLISGGQIFEEIQTPEGKEFLRVQLLTELQTIMEKEIGKPGIEQVLFTNFVMQ